MGFDGPRYRCAQGREIEAVHPLENVCLHRRDRGIDADIIPKRGRDSGFVGDTASEQRTQPDSNLVGPCFPTVDPIDGFGRRGKSAMGGAHACEARDAQPQSARRLGLGRDPLSIGIGDLRDRRVDYFLPLPFPLDVDVLLLFELELEPPPPASSSTLPDGSTAPFGPPWPCPGLLESTPSALVPWPLLPWPPP
jgi:hypothetical protein